LQVKKPEGVIADPAFFVNSRRGQGRCFAADVFISLMALGKDEQLDRLEEDRKWI
jgi:hypothetical protein